MENLDTLSRKRVVRRCKNPTCDTNYIDSPIYHFKSTLPVYYLDTDSEKVIFDICLCCGKFDFQHFYEFRSHNSLLNILSFRIPSKFLQSFTDMVDSRGDQKCLFCGQDRTIINYDEPVLNDKGHVKPNTTFPKPAIEKTVYKLFLKSENPRREYIGYLCILCRTLYLLESFGFLPLDSHSFKKDVRENCRELYEQKKKYDEQLSTLQKKKTKDSTDLRNIAITKTWNNLILYPPFESREIEFKSLGWLTTNIDLQNRTKTDYKNNLVTLTLRVPEKRALDLIKEYGSEEQKAIIHIDLNR